jgi:hypothetical protein
MKIGFAPRADKHNGAVVQRNRHGGLLWPLTEAILA